MAEQVRVCSVETTCAANQHQIGMQVEMEIEKEREAGRKRDRINGESEWGEAATKKKHLMDWKEKWKKYLPENFKTAAEEEEEEEEYRAAHFPDADWSDPLPIYALQYRDGWVKCWGGYFGSFEDTTRIPSMFYTNEPVPCHANFYRGMQIFSVKIKEARQGFQWPIHVYGIVAARDSIDHNRNVLFCRGRDNCQILTEQDPYLLLTGPSRAIMVCEDVDFEVALKVKGSIESDDKYLSLFTEPVRISHNIHHTCLMSKDYTSKLSTVKLEFGYVVRSVEATINVHITEGSWPDGYYGRFAASTSTLEHKKFLLLDSRCGKVPIDDNGIIKLSRCVTSVEEGAQLTVDVVAFEQGREKIEVVGKAEAYFTPKMAGKTSSVLDVGFCKMDVTVAWSLMSILSRIPPP